VKAYSPKCLEGEFSEVRWTCASTQKVGSCLGGKG
jgi:hypothetical protein